MISVEQIRALEERIEKALSFIASLRAENASLGERLSASESQRLRAEARAEEAELRIVELEDAAETFRKDQSRIEEGILHALEKLDAFEDLVLLAGSGSAAATGAAATGAVATSVASGDAATADRAESPAKASLSSAPQSPPLAKAPGQKAPAPAPASPAPALSTPAPRVEPAAGLDTLAEASELLPLDEGPGVPAGELDIF